jgi:hypothetical protein
MLSKLLGMIYRVMNTLNRQVVHQILSKQIFARYQIPLMYKISVGYHTSLNQFLREADSSS